MSAENNLNLGGNADLIRPKYILIYLGLFLFIGKTSLLCSNKVDHSYESKTLRESSRITHKVVARKGTRKESEEEQNEN